MLPPFAALAPSGSAGKFPASERSGLARPVEDATAGSELDFSAVLSTAKSPRAPLAADSDHASAAEDEPSTETEEPNAPAPATTPDASAAWLLAPPPPQPAGDNVDPRAFLACGSGDEGESTDPARETESAAFSRDGDGRPFFFVRCARPSTTAGEGASTPAGETSKPDSAQASESVVESIPSDQSPRPLANAGVSSGRSTSRGQRCETLSSEASAPGSAVFSPISGPRETGQPGQAGGFGKNEQQNSGYQGKAEVVIGRGMEKAKEPFAMSSSAVHDLSAASSAGAPDAFATGGLDNAAPAATPLPAAAARLIERVEQAAERLVDRPGEPVRLSLDLDGGHRVDVKVAMRGGRVFADFRSDSPEMRAALAQGWDAFVRGREGSAQRWADPVISGGVAPAPVSAASSQFSTDSRHNSSGAEQQASADQQRSSRHDPAAADEGRTLFARGLPARSVSTSASPAPAAGGDASRILSARV